MNRIIFLVLTAWFSWINFTNAQLYADIGGGYLSSISINQNNYGFSEMDYKFRSSYQLGLGLGYAISPAHHVQTGVYYSALGVNYLAEFKQEEHKKEVDLNYLQIPILYRLVSGDVSLGRTGTRFSLSVGPYFGFLLSSQIDWSVAGNTLSMVEFHQSQNRNPNIFEIQDVLGANGDPADYNDLFESTDIGVSGSIGFRSYFNDLLFFNLDAFAGYGLTDLNAENWRYENSNQEYSKSQNLFGGIRVGLGIWLTGSE